MEYLWNILKKWWPNIYIYIYQYYIYISILYIYIYQYYMCIYIYISILYIYWDNLTTNHAINWVNPHCLLIYNDQNSRISVLWIGFPINNQESLGLCEPNCYLENWRAEWEIHLMVAKNVALLRPTTKESPSCLPSSTKYFGLRFLFCSPAGFSVFSQALLSKSGQTKAHSGMPVWYEVDKP